VIHILEPAPAVSPLIAYGVLLVAFLLEGGSTFAAFREFREAKGGLGWFQAVRISKDPPAFIVLLENGAAMAGILVAAVGLALSQLSGNPFFDGAASVIIGLILGVTALVLAVESKALLIGESAGGFLVNYAGTHETPETKVAAVVDIYGPVDYAKLAELRRDHPERFNMSSIKRHAANGGSSRFFGADQLDAAGLAKLHEISPIFAVHKGMPPFLAIHGTKDDQVVYEQSIDMCNAMHKVGAVCDLITIEGGGHGMGGWKAPEMQHWKPEMIAWLKKTLAK